jgi:hypothetical protein
MKVEIIQDVIVTGEPHEAGSLLDLDPVVAHQLVNSRQARLAAEEDLTSEEEPTPPPARNKRRSTPSSEES